MRQTAGGFLWFSGVFLCFSRVFLGFLAKKRAEFVVASKNMMSFFLMVKGTLLKEGQLGFGWLQSCKTMKR